VHTEKAEAVNVLHMVVPMQLLLAGLHASYSIPVQTAEAPSFLVDASTLGLGVLPLHAARRIKIASRCMMLLAVSLRRHVIPDHAVNARSQDATRSGAAEFSFGNSCMTSTPLGRRHTGVTTADRRSSTPHSRDRAQPSLKLATRPRRGLDCAPNYGCSLAYASQSQAGMKARWLLPLMIAACSTEREPTPRAQPALSGERPQHMRNCPSAVPGAHTTTARTQNGIDVTITSPDPAVRAKIAALAQAESQRGDPLWFMAPHNGQHGGPGTIGFCPIIQTNTSVTYEPISDGVTIHVTTRGDVRALQVATESRVRALALPSS
jgi:hypothetical protein